MTNPEAFSKTLGLGLTQMGAAGDFREQFAFGPATQALVLQPQQPGGVRRVGGGAHGEFRPALVRSTAAARPPATSAYPSAELVVGSASPLWWRCPNSSSPT